MPTTATQPTVRLRAGQNLLARIGVAGVVLFFAATVVVGALTPGYSHIHATISDLAAIDNKAAGLMIAGFVALGISFLSVAVLFWQRFAGIAAGRVAAGMTGVAGIGLVVAGFAREDCSELRAGCVDAGDAPLASTHYWVHQYVSLLVFLAMSVMPFVLARGLRRSQRWAHLAAPSRIVGTLLVIGLVVLIVVGVGGYDGLVQRVFVAVMAGWPAAVAIVTSTGRAPEVA